MAKCYDMLESATGASHVMGCKRECYLDISTSQGCVCFVQCCESRRQGGEIHVVRGCEVEEDCTYI
jgi:hypothetical protein